MVGTSLAYTVHNYRLHILPEKYKDFFDISSKGPTKGLALRRAFAGNVKIIFVFFR
jgi:hypothetical protein